ncbi:TPA: hypothetical protein RRD23_001004 [Klebsiella pneumoniae]|nr:hypothetical protein [Klebsiella pneumoniae]
MSDEIETIDKNPKSWAAWKREAERLQAIIDDMALAGMNSEPDCKERKLFCSTDTARMRKVISVSAGSEDAPLYRHAQQPVVPDELLKEYLRLVQCMLSDYRDGNYGNAQRWIRHIAKASDDFERKYGLSPWEMARKTCRAAMLNGGKP